MFIRSKFIIILFNILSFSALACTGHPCPGGLPQRVWDQKPAIAEVLIISNLTRERHLVSGVFLDNRTVIIHDPFIRYQAYQEEKPTERQYSLMIHTPQDKYIEARGHCVKFSRQDGLVLLDILAAPPYVVGNYNIHNKEGCPHRFVDQGCRPECQDQSLNKLNLPKGIVYRPGMRTQQIFCEGRFINEKTVKLYDATHPYFVTGNPCYLNAKSYAVQLIENEEGLPVWSRTKIVHANPQTFEIRLEMEESLPHGKAVKASLKDLTADEQVYFVYTFSLNQLVDSNSPPFTFCPASVIDPMGLDFTATLNVAYIEPNPRPETPSCTSSSPVFNGQGEFIGLSREPFECLNGFLEMIPAKKAIQLYLYYISKSKSKHSSLDTLKTAKLEECILEISSLEALSPETAPEQGPESYNCLLVEENENLLIPKGSVLWSINNNLIGNNLELLREKVNEGLSIKLSFFDISKRPYALQTLTLPVQVHLCVYGIKDLECLRAQEKKLDASCGYLHALLTLNGAPDTCMEVTEYLGTPLEMKIPPGSFLLTVNERFIGNNLEALREEAVKNEAVRLTWLEPTNEGYIERSTYSKTFIAPEQ